MASIDLQITQQFLTLTATRTFVTFEELKAGLGMPYDELILRKQDFEEILRTEDPKLRIVSRLDLNPPGFEFQA